MARTIFAQNPEKYIPALAEALKKMPEFEVPELEVKVEKKSEFDGGIDIAFNYRFLEEFTNVLDGEILEIGFNENTSPGVFHDLKHPNFLHLVMPVKVQG